MKVHGFSLQNQLYAFTVVILLLLLTIQFTLIRWTNRSPTVLFKDDEKPKSIFMTKNNPMREKRYYHPDEYPFLITPNHCGNISPPFLAIFVASAPSHRSRRDAIRNTWGSAQNLRSVAGRLFFLIGQQDDKNSEKNIVEEAAIFKDILQIGFKDSYMNLTLKSVSALRWTIENCSGVSFLMKTDDDVFVNVEHLSSFLSSLLNQSGLYGCVKSHAIAQPKKLLKDGSLTQDHSFMGGHPPFTAGAGYVISGSLVKEMYRAALSLPLFPIEDVFMTAHCGKYIGQVPKHDKRFSCGETLQDDCAMRTKFTGHWVNEERQAKIWDKLERNIC